MFSEKLDSTFENIFWRPSLMNLENYMLVSLKLQHGITVYYKYKLHLQISLLNFGCDITRTKSVHTLQKIKKLSFLTSTLDYFLMAIISSSSPVVYHLNLFLCKIWRSLLVNWLNSRIFLFCYYCPALPLIPPVIYSVSK